MNLYKNEFYIKVLYSFKYVSEITTTFI